MKVRLDKIASSTAHVNLPPEVILGDVIEAERGMVLAVRALDTKSTYNTIEDLYGRQMPVNEGDVIAGVLGAREALRGYAGEVPSEVRPGDILHLLNMGGVIGRCTSENSDMGPPCRVEVLGVILNFPQLGRRVGVPANIFPGSIKLVHELPKPLPPVVLVAGTCMHAGKTKAASMFIREATRLGVRIGAAKVTGVALRRDALEMLDHGAVNAVTFTDVGFPSTAHVETASIAKSCMAALVTDDIDMVVVELGDGLMGSYGVQDILADRAIRSINATLIIAANDPVGAWGAVKWLERYDWLPDLMTGPATDNRAGTDAIHDTTGVLAINARTEPERMTKAILATTKAKQS